MSPLQSEEGFYIDRNEESREITRFIIKRNCNR